MPLLIKAGLFGAGICLPVALLELGVQTVLFGEDRIEEYSGSFRYLIRASSLAFGKDLPSFK